MPLVFCSVPVPFSLHNHPTAVALVAINVTAGSPAHIVSLFTAATGNAFTVTVVAADVALHPFPSVYSTV